MTEKCDDIYRRNGEQEDDDDDDNDDYDNDDEEDDYERFMRHRWSDLKDTRKHSRTTQKPQWHTGPF